VILRRLQLLDNAKAPNDKLVDLEPADSCPSDCQATNSESADSQRAHRNGASRNGRKRYLPDRLCSNRLCSNCTGTDFDRWTTIEPRLRIGSIDVGGACTAFTR
jgi:hypothetical protein